MLKLPSAWHWKELAAGERVKLQQHKHSPKAASGILFLRSIACNSIVAFQAQKSHTHYENFLLTRPGGWLLEVNLMVCVEAPSVIIFPPALTVRLLPSANATVYAKRGDRTTVEVKWEPLWFFSMNHRASTTYPFATFLPRSCSEYK